MERWLSGEWLHGDGLKELERAALRGIGGGEHLESERGRFAISRAAGIAHDGGELLQQRLETVHGDAIVERAPSVCQGFKPIAFSSGNRTMTALMAISPTIAMVSESIAVESGVPFASGHACYAKSGI